MKTCKTWGKGGFIIVSYPSDDDGVVVNEAVATHNTIIYEYLNAGIKDAINASRSYVIVPR